MAYKDKQRDHEKRKNQEGSYSLYNYIYHYLMDNFEPGQVTDATHQLLYREAKAYCLKGGKQVSDKEIKSSIEQAISNFNSNNGEHGDTANNLGKAQSNSLNTIKSALSDLRW